ncbi:unnamed protein product [Meganyctiphanes norvegica]|uniref:Uncharacterized protein n=1 Tax=Meganyctiphanes norvegica TaxID=48144 RepID=A0AAV2Q498_MEGNR
MTSVCPDELRQVLQQLQVEDQGELQMNVPEPRHQQGSRLQSSPQRSFHHLGQQNRPCASFFSDDNRWPAIAQSCAEMGLREEQMNAYDNLAVEQHQALQRLHRDWPYLRGRLHTTQQGGNWQGYNISSDQQRVQQQGNCDAMGNSQDTAKQMTKYVEVENQLDQHGVQYRNNKYCGEAVNFVSQHAVQQATNHDKLLKDQTQYSVCMNQMGKYSELVNIQPQYVIKQPGSYDEMINYQAQHAVQQQGSHGFIVNQQTQQSGNYGTAQNVQQQANYGDMVYYLAQQVAEKWQL